MSLEKLPLINRSISSQQPESLLNNTEGEEENSCIESTTKAKTINEKEADDLITVADDIESNKDDDDDDDSDCNSIEHITFETIKNQTDVLKKENHNLCNLNNDSLFQYWNIFLKRVYPLLLLSRSQYNNNNALRSPNLSFQNTTRDLVDHYDSLKSLEHYALQKHRKWGEDQLGEVEIDKILDFGFFFGDVLSFFSFHHDTTVLQCMQSYLSLSSRFFKKEESSYTSYQDKTNVLSCYNRNLIKVTNNNQEEEEQEQSSHSRAYHHLKTYLGHIVLHNNNNIHHVMKEMDINNNFKIDKFPGDLAIPNQVEKAFDTFFSLYKLYTFTKFVFPSCPRRPRRIELISSCPRRISSCPYRRRASVSSNNHI